MKQKSSIKGVLKNESQNKQAKKQVIQRFDRKGQAIKQGVKYEVTINENIEIIQLMSDRTPFDDQLLKSPQQCNDTITDFSKNGQKKKQKLTLDPKEEQFLQMLNQNLEKNRKNAQKKQCCSIQ